VRSSKRLRQEWSEDLASPMLLKRTPPFRWWVHFLAGVFWAEPTAYARMSVPRSMKALSRFLPSL
jgi:hypothetical protein